MRVSKAGKKRTYNKPARGLARMNSMLRLFAAATGQPLQSLEDIERARFDLLMAGNAAMFARIRAEAGKGAA